jgi:hypothetical protein
VDRTFVGDTPNVNANVNVNATSLLAGSERRARGRATTEKITPAKQVLVRISGRGSFTYAFTFTFTMVRSHPI